MRSPSLSTLPEPPQGKTGWPWTEESVRLPERTADWPRVSVVTPSFNQGQFIEETIRSVLLQGYPNLELFVLDGGSTDNTKAVLEKYSKWIDFWVSEPDGGQSAAINRGLRMASGAYATWINSDDMLCQHALTRHFERHDYRPDVVYLGDCVNIDAEGRATFVHRGRVATFEDLVRFRSVWASGGFICQQEVLFPRQLALDVGGLNEADHYSMDYELWGKFLLAGARFEYTGVPFGMFRWHAAQKTHAAMKQVGATLDAAERLLAMDRSLQPAVKAEIFADLQAYRSEYPAATWARSGRLARLGLPRSLVTRLRGLRASLSAGRIGTNPAK